MTWFASRQQREPSLRDRLNDALRSSLHKRVQIEVMDQANKKVIRRFRFTPPDDPSGRKHRFTGKGVEQVLDNFIDSFERDNPNHRYRLVVCKDKFKLVWEPEESPASPDIAVIARDREAEPGNAI